MTAEKALTGRFGPFPVRTPGRFGPIPFRSGRFGLGRFGPISGVSRFSPTGAGRFGPISKEGHFGPIPYLRGGSFRPDLFISGTQVR